MKYWWAAFNAKPFGMPIPPNWFGLAAIALLGAFLNPGLWLFGAGLELAYLKTLSGNATLPQDRRCRTAASAPEVDPADARYDEF